MKREKLKANLLEAWDNLVRGTSHTVGYPIYRILALFVLPPCFLQLVLWRAPNSVVEATPTWYDSIFIVLQLIGALLVIISLAMGDTPEAAKVEGPGCWLMGGMGIAYFISAWIYVGPVPPLTVASWLQLGFSVFCFVRIRQLRRKLDRLAAQVALEKLTEEESGNVG